MTRDDLKDAVVDAAREFRASKFGLWSQLPSEPNARIAAIRRWGEVDKRLTEAIDALEAHDRAEQERIEKHLREHAFVPGDPDGWARYTPELCDTCGKSEAEHGGSNE